jgi:hypothetical protein
MSPSLSPPHADHDPHYLLSRRDRSCRLINKKLSEKGSESKKLQFSKSPPKPIMPTSSGPVPSRVVMFDPMEVHALIALSPPRCARGD